MKTFKKFLQESGTKGVPVVSIDKNHVDLKSVMTINELNRNLSQVSSVGFVNPYNALEKISKVISTYGLTIPRVNMLNEPNGKVVFEMQQFGNHTGWVPVLGKEINGMQTIGKMVPPQGSDNTDQKIFLYFSYHANSEGIYECHASVMGSEAVSSFITK